MTENIRFMAFKNATDIKSVITLLCCEIENDELSTKNLGIIISSTEEIKKILVEMGEKIGD